MATIIDGGGEPSRFALLREGARIQRRVIGALMMRELHTRYGRENIGYIWLFLEPMLLATMIALIHQRTQAHFGPDFDPIPYTFVGYCNFMTFRSIVNRSEGALEANVTLLYHRTISVFDILMSRALLECASTFIAFCVLVGLAIAAGLSDLPARPLYYLLGVFLMLWFCTGLSFIICSITHDNRSLGRLVHPITYIMLPLSGTFFMLERIPGAFRSVVEWIPLAHIFELLRYGWFEAASPEYIDWMYLGGWLLATSLIGLLLISVVRQRIHMA